MAMDPMAPVSMKVEFWTEVTSYGGFMVLSACLLIVWSKAVCDSVKVESSAKIQSFQVA